MVDTHLSSDNFTAVQVRLSHDRDTTATNLQRLLDVDGGMRPHSSDQRRGMLACLHLLGETIDLMMHEPHPESVRHRHEQKRLAFLGLTGDLSFSWQVLRGETVERLTRIELKASNFLFTLFLEPNPDAQPERHLRVSWDWENVQPDKPAALFLAFGLNEERLHLLAPAEELGENWQVVREQDISVFLQTIDTTPAAHL